MKSDDYFAGHFDGEGTLGLERNGVNRWRLRIAVCQCHRAVLYEYRERFGGRVRLKQKRKDKHRTQWVWVLDSQADVLRFLEAIENRTMEKREQIKLGLEWIRRRMALNRATDEFRDFGNRIAKELATLKHIDGAS